MKATSTKFRMSVDEVQQSSASPGCEGTLNRTASFYTARYLVALAPFHVPLHARANVLLEMVGFWQFADGIV